MVILYSHYMKKDNLISNVIKAFFSGVKCSLNLKEFFKILDRDIRLIAFVLISTSFQFFIFGTVGNFLGRRYNPANPNVNTNTGFLYILFLKEMYFCIFYINECIFIYIT